MAWFYTPPMSPKDIKLLCVISPPALDQDGDTSGTMLLSVLALSRIESTPESMGEETVQSISK